MSIKIPGYEMLRPIAEGGMASVFLAEQKSLGRYVALKLLKRFDNPDQARRFQNEGRIIASLNHRNIITIHDIGVCDDRHYISMEYLEGGDLEGRIQAGMDIEAALDLLEVMGSCLEFLHSKSIIHRDIKPANILFHMDGTPILTDFGVARQLEADMRLTMEGSAVGSPHYLSPEQAECKPLDGRTDIYSLGIIFHEMVTGVKPFQGDSHIETILAHLTEPLPSLPPALERYQGLLERMLAKDPEDRFATAGEMLGYIRMLREHKPVVGAGAGRFADPGGIYRRVAAARARQLLQTPARALRQLSGKIFTHVPGNIRQRQAIVVASVVLMAITGLLMLQPGVQTGQKVNGMDSHAMTVSLSSSVPEQGVVHGMNPPAADTVKSVNSIAIAETPAEPVKTTGDNPPLPDILPSAAVTSAYTDAESPLEGSRETDSGGEQTFAFTPQASDTPARPQEELLLLARRAIDEYRLTTPAGNNAYFYFHSVLEDDPDNEEALAGVERIAGIYATLAEREIDRFHYSKAGTFIERGLSVDPDNARLRELERNRTLTGISGRAIGKVKSLFQ